MEFQLKARTGRANPLRDVIWADAWIVFAAIVFSFFAAILQLTVPFFIVLIYDRVVPSRSQETLVGLAILAVTLIILMGIFDYARRRLMARYGARVQEALEDEAVAATTQAEINGTEVQNLDAIRKFFHSHSVIAVIDVFWTPLFVGAIFVLHPYLGWTAVTGLLTLVLVFMVGSFLSEHRKEIAQAARHNVSGLATDIKRSGDVISAHHLKPAIFKLWKSARTDSRRWAIKARDQAAGFKTLLRVIRTTYTVAILGVGTTLVLSSAISVGALVAAMILMNRAFLPFTSLFSEWPNILDTRKAWRKTEQALVKSGPTPKPVIAALLPQGRFVADKVTIASDHSRKVLLRQINLTIRPGEFVEITGSIGSGKTLLAQTLIGQRAPATGKVTWGGINLQFVKAELLGNCIGYLPENVRFFPGTIAQNISAFDPDPHMKDVQRAARTARMQDTIQSLPLGYDTMLDQNASGLSQGQRKLLGFARAIYGDPQLLVLDEPGRTLLDALGGDTEAAIERFLSRGRSILLLGCNDYRLPQITHRFALRNGVMVHRGDMQLVKSECRKTVIEGFMS